MKKGFTMIELIFVIVILGILAAVAIPKLAATRNDAKIAAEMTNVAQVISNLGAEFTSQGAWNNTDPATEGQTLKCFDVTDAGATDGNVSVQLKGGATAACPQAVLDGVTAKAIANGVVDDATTAKIYSFGGVGVVE